MLQMVMNSNAKYKEKALQFLKQYEVQDLSLKILQNIIKQQGYQLVFYNTFDYEESTELLLKELDLKEYSCVNKAFTYKNGSIKIVFLDDSLLENDKVYALLHEEGHIFCGHMERNGCSAANVEDEREANEFAHYIVDPPLCHRIESLIKAHRKLFTVSVCVVALAILIPVVITQIQTAILRNSTEYVKTLDYYITESGEKYHKENCRIIQGKDNVRRITEEEFNSGKYEPCKVCEP